MRHLSQNAWQAALSDLITDPAELLALLGLDTALLPLAIASAREFPLKVPRGFVKRMQKGNPNDPLLRQVLPLGDELLSVPAYVTDPLGEMAVNRVPGLLHKYHGRILVTLTSACAVHCRYCFRRHFPYDDNNPGWQGWEKLAAYIAADDSIREVILSGGDPLAVSDRLLHQFADLLSPITHVKRLRVHSRLPVVLPERVTPQLIDWFHQPRFETVLVMHANHPNEIDDEVAAVWLSMKRSGVQLLNQSVLLKGVNDEAAVLIALSERLFSSGILPYYLHLLDKVKGAAHFEVPLDKAKIIYREMCKKLPGYLVPKLVVEEAGAASKTLLHGLTELIPLNNVN